MQKLKFLSKNGITQIIGKNSFGTFYCGQLSMEFKKLGIKHDILVEEDKDTITMEVKSDDFSTYLIKKLDS